MSISCLGGILGWIWSFVKNFFEGHTRPHFFVVGVTPAPLCNEPGYFDRFTNLLCVNLLQHWYTCFCVAMSVKISVFGGYFWRGGFVYILRKWIFYFALFPILFYLILSQFVTHLFLPLFCSFCLVLSYLILPLFRLFWFVCFDSFLPLIRAICPIVFCAIVSRGGAVSLLTRWLTCHVNELPRYHVAILFALRLQLLQLLGVLCQHPPATPAADR